MKNRYWTALALVVSMAVPCPSLAQVTRIADVISQVKSRHAPDKRQVIYEVKAHEDGDGKVVVDGVISESSVRDSLVSALDRTGLEYVDALTVYPYDQWAMPRISVANLRTAPGHGSEMASQALMGMPLRLLCSDGEWWRVQTPDGYIAWVVDNSLAFKTETEMDSWRSADRVVVTSTYQTRAYSSPTSTGVRDVVTDLVNGDILVFAGTNPINGRAEVILPDGRHAWVAENEITSIGIWAGQEFDAEKILDMAYSMEGQPYLWGGTSTKSLDCSGLAKVCYLSNGIILRRDASQQALTGTRIEASAWRDCKSGDLLFFGNAKTGRVTHVAIYDHDGDYVHSSGRVKRNSVDPSSDGYLSTPFLHAVRIHGNEGTDGITRVCDHPWYFNLDGR